MSDDVVGDDVDLDGELGFAPAVAVTGAEDAPHRGTAGPRGTRTARGGRRGLRRRLAAGAVLIGALGAMAGGYAAFAGSSGAADTTNSVDDVSAGRQIYDVSCITCHGANLQGVPGRGITLLGVGGASVYFQVSTGRMPLVGQGPQADRKTAKFTEQQTDQLAAFVQSVAGGPMIPQGDLQADSSGIAAGGDLFRLNCASCHGTTFRGAPLSAGKQAPVLYNANDKQIYSAMLTGPENMPVFSDNVLTPDEKREIVAYVQTMKASKDPGGHGIGRIGPVSEAIVCWVAGVGALMIVILWIGVKAE